MNSKILGALIGLLVLSTCLTASADWEGDTITGTVDLPTLPPVYDGQFDWDNSTATVSFSDIEFTAVFTNVTSTADFSANTVTLRYENTTLDSFDITYPEIDYFFGSLDVGPYGISSLTLLDSDFTQADLITSSFTSDSITLNMPMQNTNPGESFFATFEFGIATAPTQETSVPVPAMSLWALLILPIILGLIVFSNRRNLFQ